jgi:hypothetical protein
LTEWQQCGLTKAKSSTICREMDVRVLKSGHK